MGAAFNRAKDFVRAVASGTICVDASARYIDVAKILHDVGGSVFQRRGRGNAMGCAGDGPDQIGDVPKGWELVDSMVEECCSVLSPDGAYSQLEAVDEADWAIVRGTEISTAAGPVPVKSDLPASAGDQLEYLGIRSVNLNDVAWTQASIRDTFRDGRALSDLVRELNDGAVSLSHPRLKIRVIDWPGRGLKSLDNRRLSCFKEHQAHVGGDVFIQADVWRLPDSFVKLAASSPIVEVFLKHYEQDGADVPFVRRTHLRHE